jgi:hypothetical protein
MEALLILANFTGMMLLLIWSARAERAGKDGPSAGIFAYSQRQQPPKGDRNAPSARKHR